jgi:hypothetical protein
MSYGAFLYSQEALLEERTSKVERDMEWMESFLEDLIAEMADAAEKHGLILSLKRGVRLNMDQNLGYVKNARRPPFANDMMRAAISDSKIREEVVNPVVMRKKVPHVWIEMSDGQHPMWLDVIGHILDGNKWSIQKALEARFLEADSFA